MTWRFSRGCLCATIGWLLVTGCSEQRETEEQPAPFENVSPILDASCLPCHEGPDAEAGYRVEDYFTTIYCIPDSTGEAAAQPPDADAPLLAVLQQDDHQGLIDAEEEQALEDWVFTGAQPRRRGSHPSGFGDPFSVDWHGTYLREEAWLPLTDPERPDACGLCHAGAVTEVPGVLFPAPGATDCTVCHDEPEGVMACGTCHGDGPRPYPPRDQCYFRGPPDGGLHDTHTMPSTNGRHPLTCQTCHFGQDYEALDGSHANDVVDVVFQPAWGASASYDFEAQTCDTSCHARGGADPVVAWNDPLQIDCGSCHQNPPPGHSDIACNGCHRGIDPDGTELSFDAPHLNGRVDAF